MCCDTTDPDSMNANDLKIFTRTLNTIYYACNLYSLRQTSDKFGTSIQIAVARME